MLKQTGGIRVVAMVVALCGGGLAGHAQAPATVPVMMLSDIHFDPFHDPGKVARLVAAPVAEWDGILSAPDTATQASDFASLQSDCGAKGIDTPMPLLESSLAAEQKVQPDPLFVTVSGDLMAHKFACKFQKMEPKATAAEYSAFAAKTVAFVALELHKTFPKSPVYFALGNNDSGCEDYKEDPGSAFLKGDAASFAVDALNADNQAAILHESAELGDYSVELPKPMNHTRLIVMQDIFESKKYTNCAGAEDAKAATEQINWLKANLAEAAGSGHIWVMAHIPPGIDAYSTLSKGGVCGGEKPKMFLDSTALGDALTKYGGVTLALFGHTHMDEIKLLQGPIVQGNQFDVPVKLVPSITPVDGNNPSFTVARVDPKTAVLMDYTVYAANNQTGIGTMWNKEYTYSTTYGMPDFSAASVKKLTTGFLADKAGSSPNSRAYENDYFVGDPGISASLKAAAMRLVWPGYVCSMTEMGPESYRSCACPAKPQ